MGHGASRVRLQSKDYMFFGSDRGAERWRNWACGHNQSAEYDGSSTIMRRSWLGRSAVPVKSAR